MTAIHINLYDPDRQWSLTSFPGYDNTDDVLHTNGDPSGKCSRCGAYLP